MNIKHKIVKDFQFLSEDKKIVILKAGVVIESYIYKSKSDEIKIDPDIVNSNPQYFLPVDWKQELISYMRQNKLPTPAILGKKLIPFIEEMFVIGSPVEKSNDELESEYKNKLKLLSEREADLDREYRTKLRSISDKETDYEIRIKRLEKKESEINTEYDDISKREIDLKIGLSELREKEDKIRTIEFEFNKKERDIDRTMLESEKTLDEKQREMNDKIEKKLLDIDKREMELNRKEKEMSEEFDAKSNEYQESYKRKMSELDEKELSIKSINIDKIHEIENLVLEYYNEVPWHHNNMIAFKNRIENILSKFNEVRN